MRYNIITIEREYASGGTEIGNRLSEVLNIPCYGQEILESVARKRGTTPQQLVHMEETATGSLLYSIAMAARMVSGQSDGLSEENELYLEESRVIHDLANQGPCIIVGRCAGWVLRERRDVLNVFIHADREFRRRRAVEVYKDKPDKIDGYLKRCDRRRDNFYGANTGKRWDDKGGYHLMLDSGRLGIERCVDIICTSAR